MRSLLTSPPTAIGHYRVEALTSSGGFGAVYRVTRDGQPFALKVPLAGTPQSSDERRVTEQRIVREVVSLMTLDHPGLVKVHAFDRWPDPATGNLYLVMDLVEGVPLLDWRRNERPTLRELVEVFRDLALAVDAMHRLGIVHRDVKSANVLVAQSAIVKWQPVLVDFGLARPAFTTDVTREHVLVGTDGHWAPEHLDLSTPHASYTAASDLHCLGHLFYEALTGRAPFRAVSSGALLTAVLAEVPPPPSHLAPLLPSELDDVVLRLLAKRPEARTPTGGALADELGALLARADERWDVPVEPAPPSTPDAQTSPARPAFMPGPPSVTARGSGRAPARRAPRNGAKRALTSAAAGLAVVCGVIWGLRLGGWRPEAPRPGPRAPPPAIAISALVARAPAAAATAPAAARVPSPARVPQPKPAPKTSAVATATAIAPQSSLVRAALVGHARPGPAQAVLRQPVLLATTALPTGSTLDGTADELPDGRYLLRFDTIRRADGSALPLRATALVGARAAERHPLKPGAAPPGFEFDLALSSK